MNQPTDNELHQIEQRGKRASEILNDPIFQQALMQMKGRLLIEFQDSDLSNDAERLNAWQKGQLLNQFEKEFTTLIKGGENARVTLIERAKATIRNII